MINNDPSMHVFYHLEVTFQYTDAVMAAPEQAAIKSIWNKCVPPSRPLPHDALSLVPWVGGRLRRSPIGA